MSISGRIRHRIFALVKSRKLARVRPLFPMDPVYRCLLVGADVWEATRGPFSDDFTGERQAHFRAALDQFVSGGELAVADDPYDKDPDAMLARINPIHEEVWDIRIVEPGSGVRCFGRFVARDTFVGLGWDYRENIRSSGEWDHMRNHAIEVWRTLFGDLEPFRGDRINDYLSCNYRAVSPRRR